MYIHVLFQKKAPAKYELCNINYEKRDPSVFESRVFHIHNLYFILLLHIAVAMLNTFDEFWNIFFFQRIKYALSFFFRA